MLRCLRDIAGGETCWTSRHLDGLGCEASCQTVISQLDCSSPLKKLHCRTKTVLSMRLLMPTGRLAYQELVVMLLCRLAWKGCSSGTRGMRSASLLGTFSVCTDCAPSALQRSQAASRRCHVIPGRALHGTTPCDLENPYLKLKTHAASPGLLLHRKPCHEHN